MVKERLAQREREFELLMGTKPERVTKSPTNLTKGQRDCHRWQEQKIQGNRKKI
jgi:hypothetical protein